eukprot:scaffold75072_cov19-Tisochrysis_lutea.AAC.3
MRPVPWGWGAGWERAACEGAAGEAAPGSAYGAHGGAGARQVCLNLMKMGGCKRECVRVCCNSGQEHTLTFPGLQDSKMSANEDRLSTTRPPRAGEQGA